MYKHRFATEQRILKTESTFRTPPNRGPLARAPWPLVFMIGALILAGVAALVLLTAPALAGAPSVMSAQGAQPAKNLPDSREKTSTGPPAPLDDQAAPATPDCSPDWAASPGPSNNAENDLGSVAAVSATDIWAVGYYSYGSYKTLTEHWNGSAWSVVASPNVDLYDNYLTGVSAVSTSDVWAVGYYLTGSNVDQTLIEHWNGSAWSVVSSPNVGSFKNYLSGIASASGIDVWAVGYYENGTNFQTLIERWSGNGWSIVSSPNVGPYNNFLYGVVAVSASDVWAVGSWYYNIDFHDHTLTEHWNGSAWSVVYSPDTGTASDYLQGVSAVSASDVWAVGYFTNQIGGTKYTLIEHWDGGSWSIVPSPNLPTYDNVLYDVSAISASDVWAAGQYGGNATLYLHWNGSTWMVVSSPPTSGFHVLPSGIVALSTSNVWAVDEHVVGLSPQTLIEHWDGNSWSIVPSANARIVDNAFNSVTAMPANSVMAVGYFSDGNRYRTLAAIWDGNIWSTLASANVGTNDNFLSGVAAISAGDVWAVGDYSNGSVFQTLAEHWDGTAWTIVPSPNVGSSHNGFKQVAAASSGDVWAVGTYYTGSVYRTLIEHWNGTNWSTFAGPNPGTGNNDLNGVAAVQGTDVWAVGDYSNGGSSQTLIERWNGSIWSVVPSPNVGTNDTLYAVESTGQSASDVWAVGKYSSGGVDRTLIEHWNGSTWSVVASPNPGTAHNFLTGVSGLSAGDAWAVGYYSNGGVYQPLIEHWNGTSWSVVGARNLGTSDNFLNGIAATSATDVRAVGYYRDGSAQQLLVERYNPCTTSCPIQFQDIPSNHTFYANIRCLACRGIISGYACGGTNEPCVPPNNYPYFRSSKNVTRGQIAKIVALSAQVNSLVSGQTFEDVPPGSTFYTYTEQLVGLGVMSGYPCGGTGEPCVPPLNRPYFRPNNVATRGQLAKIVANTAGFSDPVSGQIFQDVPSNSPFYVFIQRLASRNIMGGYACGSPEPCVPPLNRPYFRPGSLVTRGQTSKIVGNTFYPDCYTPLKPGD